MILKELPWVLMLLVFEKMLYLCKANTLYHKNMSKLLDDVLNFLSTATPEQLQENWKHLEPYENIGPNAGEFIKCCEYQSYCIDTSTSVIINDKKNPEYNFGFFCL